MHDHEIWRRQHPCSCEQTRIAVASLDNRLHMQSQPGPEENKRCRNVQESSDRLDGCSNQFCKTNLHFLPDADMQERGCQAKAKCQAGCQQGF